MPGYPHLFSPFQLGSLELRNRAVMSPMTRNRAIDNVPNDLMAEYYAQRASAGLIITEGTAPSPNGLGYPRIPGAYSDAQVEGWRKVTESVHARGGAIFLQLMHVGRIAHANNMPSGTEIVGPSAIAAAGKMYTDSEGPMPHPTPREMTADDIEQAIGEYVHASKRAIEAGFDGVELHAANGYLIDQFLQEKANHRTDDFGGSGENRNRFALTVADRAAAAIGPDRVGIRVSPYGYFNDVQPFEGIDEQYMALAKGLGELKLAYVHIADMSGMGAPEVPFRIKAAIKEAFGRPLLLSGGYDAARAEVDLAEGKGDLIAFGRPFLANPDLLDRFRQGASLNEPDHDTFYTPGPEGYTDYPTL